MGKDRKSGGRRRLALLLSMCLLLTAVSVAASAAAPEHVTLTVRASENFPDEAAEADFQSAGIVLDLYLVATWNDTPGESLFVPVSPFDTLEIGREIDGDGWNALALEAAAIVRNGATPVITGAQIGEKLEADDAGNELVRGLYLALARGEADEDYWTETGEEGEKEIATLATGDVNVYIFSPLLASLPTKADGNGDGVITTAQDDGAWVADVELLLKYSMEARFTELIIEKTVEDFEGEEAAFVFDVVATLRGQVVYTNTATIRMGMSGTQTATLDRIPAGAQVTVTEVYDGGRYTISGPDTVIIEAMSATEENIVSFQNVFNGSGIGGHGIENHFVYTEGETGDTWQLEQR